MRKKVNKNVIKDHYIRAEFSLNFIGYLGKTRKLGYRVKELTGIKHATRDV